MSMMEQIGTASDHVMAALVAGLELEFGRGAGEGLAQRFLDAEEVDFLWDARLQERWIGSYPNEIDDDLELDRIEILARLDARWIVARVIVDGDGRPHGLLGRRDYRTRCDAEQAFGHAH